MRRRRSRSRSRRRRRRKKRTKCLEGEREIKDPKSGQDGQVSAIGKGNEAKEHIPNGGFVQSKIKMWIAQVSFLQHTGTHRPHLARQFRITLKAEAEKRSRHVHPWLKSTMVLRHDIQKSYQTIERLSRSLAIKNVENRKGAKRWWVGGWVGGWMDGWVGGWMDGWVDGWISMIV